MFGRIWHVLVKEFIELRRDRWAMFRLLVPPIAQVLVFGYAASFEVFDVSTVVLDLDRSQESRALVDTFAANPHFQIVDVVSSQHDLEEAVNRSRAALGIVIHAGFSQRLRKGQVAPLQVLVDGTNSNSALIAMGYVSAMVDRFSSTYRADLIARLHPSLSSSLVTINLDDRPWYNASLDSRWFFVPGVISTITLVMVVNLTAFAIVREREVGTLEQLMVTPVRPYELMIGKLVPFFCVGLAIAGAVTLVGTLWFRVPFRGSVLVLVAGTSLYLLSTLSLGLMISTVCRTQQQAFATNFFLVNPLFILSGFSFPIASMPDLLQWLTYANPVRYYIVIIRSVFLKGVGISILAPHFIALGLIGISLMTVAVLRFRAHAD